MTQNTNSTRPGRLMGWPLNVFALTVILSLVLAGPVASSANGEAQDPTEDTCVLCHSSESFIVSNPNLRSYWLRYSEGTHAQNDVSCADCHGGDSRAHAKGAAHPKNLSPDNPGSWVNYSQVSKTCGSCHADMESAYLTSRHAQRLAEGDTAPNCVTCHGSVSAKAPTSISIVDVCLQCHGERIKKPEDLAKRAGEVRRSHEISRGYLRWLKAHPDELHPGELAQLEARADSLAVAWHRFDLESMETASDSLRKNLRKVKRR